MRDTVFLRRYDQQMDIVCHEHLSMYSNMIERRCLAKVIQITKIIDF